MMLDKAVAVRRRYDELNTLMATPEVASDPDKIRVYAQEQAEITEIAEAYAEHQALSEELAATRAMLDSETSPEMQELISDEVASLEERIASLEQRLTTLLLPRDPRDTRNVIVEIRAGAGGDEAGSLRPTCSACIPSMRTSTLVLGCAEQQRDRHRRL
jgi:peptide chain release factor 1